MASFFTLRGKETFSSILRTGEGLHVSPPLSVEERHTILLQDKLSASLPVKRKMRTTSDSLHSQWTASYFDREDTPFLWRDTLSSSREEVCCLQCDLTDIIYVVTDRPQVNVAKHIGEKISVHQFRAAQGGNVCTGLKTR